MYRHPLHVAAGYKSTVATTSVSTEESTDQHGRAGMSHWTSPSMHYSTGDYSERQAAGYELTQGVC